MPMTKVNFKSDLPPIAITFKVNGVSVNVPDHDFAIRFFVDGAPGKDFICAKEGNVYRHCEKTNATTLTCYIDNHGFGCGRLCCEFVDLATNAKYADGKQKTVTPNRLDLVLVEGDGDSVVSTSASVVIDIEALIADVYAALEEMEGYADIIAALQAAVLTIPLVVDDLVTGGHTAALSAEQGKILKQLIDRLEQISVEGIRGFIPISSLNELPVNPTNKQKGYGYLYENAVYVYVGSGGDALGGLYRSVDLVSLDWGDKSYAPLEYSGFGRTWLKKNMVEGVNVLTAAMISTDNTEYFIQYDYDLDGATVTLPANASLVFMGGSIKNGTLNGNNTRIQAKKGVCIFDGITIQGTWDVTEAYSSWFKMHKRGYKIASVTENGTTIGGTSYATFRIEGDNTDYVAAPAGVSGAFDASSYEQYDDTAALQSLLDIRAKKTVVEDGIYIIKGDANYYNNSYSGLYVDGHKDSELVLDGWLKVYPNDRTAFKSIDVIGCENFKISGKGGIQGDLLDHTGANPSGSFYSEWGMNIAIANTRNLVVEGITSAYAWGDCIYSHWWSNGRASMNVQGNDLQKFHTYKNVNIIYGGRTGYGCELADNVVFDGCYFYGNGRVRGKATNSAVDIEPFNYSDVPQRYVMNYEFKNNVFKNSANGIRLERCVNCSVHDNYFDYGWVGVYIVWHGDVSYDITSPTDRGWLKSYLKIYNNQIKRCTRGVVLGYSTQPCDNVEVYGNTLVSCTNTFITPNNILRNCKIFNNTTYGCGQWQLYALKDCEIYNNRCYGCKMPESTATWGANTLLYMRNIDGSKGSSFHDNHFFLDYGESIYGLGEYGKEELYHGMPVGYKYVFCTLNSMSDPSKIYFHDNELSDDFVVYWGSSSSFQGNSSFRGGICSVRDEQSEVFLEGDTFRSTTYGDEGIVVAGGIMSCSWLKTEAEGGVVRVFEPYMEVAYGEIIKHDTRYFVCNRAGTCGATLELGQGECGTARFLTKNPYAPDSTSANRVKIVFTTRGFCTSETRPDSFLYDGRKMWETDTNREIIYDGSDWVYNDIYTEPTE